MADLHKAIDRARELVVASQAAIDVVRSNAIAARESLVAASDAAKGSGTCDPMIVDSNEQILRNVIDTVETKKVALLEATACSADTVLECLLNCCRTLDSVSLPEYSTAPAVSDSSAVLERAHSLFVQPVEPSGLFFIAGVFSVSELSNELGRVCIHRAVKTDDMAVVGIPRISGWNVGPRGGLRFFVELSEPARSLPGEIDEVLAVMVAGLQVSAELHPPAAGLTQAAIKVASSQISEPFPLAVAGITPDISNRRVVVSIPLVSGSRPIAGSYIQISRVEFAGNALALPAAAASILIAANHDACDEGPLCDIVAAGELDGVIRALSQGASTEERQNVSTTSNSLSCLRLIYSYLFPHRH